MKFPDQHAALGAHLRQLRKARRMTQEQLADEAGVSRAMVQFIEYGAHSPSLEFLLSLSTAFSLPLVELITIKGVTDQVLLKQP